MVPVPTSVPLAAAGIDTELPPEAADSRVQALERQLAEAKAAAARERAAVVTLKREATALRTTLSAGEAGAVAAAAADAGAGGQDGDESAGAAGVGLPVVRQPPPSPPPNAPRPRGPAESRGATGALQHTVWVGGIPADFLGDGPSEAGPEPAAAAAGGATPRRGPLYTLFGQCVCPTSHVHAQGSDREYF